MSKTIELDAESILRELLQSHFYMKRLEWFHREGLGIVDVNPDLYAKIRLLMPEIIEDK